MSLAGPHRTEASPQPPARCLVLKPSCILFLSLQQLYVALTNALPGSPHLSHEFQVRLLPAFPNTDLCGGQPTHLPGPRSADLWYMPSRALQRLLHRATDVFVLLTCFLSLVWAAAMQVYSEGQGGGSWGRTTINFVEGGLNASLEALGAMGNAEPLVEVVHVCRRLWAAVGVGAR
jgi:hypothetical protein